MRIRYAEFARAAGRPILNGEFSFAARDAGFPNTRALGEVVATQAERGALRRLRAFHRRDPRGGRAPLVGPSGSPSPGLVERRGRQSGSGEQRRHPVYGPRWHDSHDQPAARRNPWREHRRRAGPNLGVVAEQPARGRTCFAETGRCVAPKFLAYWTQHGGWRSTASRSVTRSRRRWRTANPTPCSILSGHASNPIPRAHHPSMGCWASSGGGFITRVEQPTVASRRIAAGRDRGGTHPIGAPWSERGYDGILAHPLYWRLPAAFARVVSSARLSTL